MRVARLPTLGDFALEVHGDSMTGAGIYEGDLVIAQRVEAWEDIPPNSMVVALVDEETTLKYLIGEADLWSGGRWWLRAANPAYSDVPIDPQRSSARSCHVYPNGAPSDCANASRRG